MRGAELLKNALQNEECGVATVILRERAKRWQQEKNGPGEGNEFDWGGRILSEIKELGGDGAVARFLDEKVSWKQIKPELKELVRTEVERRQQGRMQGLKKSPNDCRGHAGTCH